MQRASIKIGARVDLIIKYMVINNIGVIGLLHETDRSSSQEQRWKATPMSKAISLLLSHFHSHGHTHRGWQSTRSLLKSNGCKEKSLSCPSLTLSKNSWMGTISLSSKLLIHQLNFCIYLFHFFFYIGIIYLCCCR